MRSTILFIFLLPSFGLFAQKRNLSFYHLSVENGLPKRSATNILQDKYGYIWVCTGAGLVRYDGYGTKIYLKKFGIGFFSAPNEVFQDREGELWVGTRYKGLLRYNRYTDSFKQCIFFPGTSAANNITSIQEDRDGNIWTISSDIFQKKYFISCLSKATGEWKHFSNSDSGIFHINATEFFTLLADTDGQIWIGTNNGLYNYNTKSRHFVRYQNGRDLIHQYLGRYLLFQSPSNPDFIWMDFEDLDSRQQKPSAGLFRFNRNDHTFKEYLRIAGNNQDLSRIPTTAMEDSKKRLWMATSNGLLQFNREADSFIHYSPNLNNKNPFVGGVINCTEDRKGNIWYSNPIDGLFYFNTREKIFTHYPANPDNPMSLQNNFITGLLLDNIGTLWVSEGSEGVQWVNKKVSIFIVYPDKTKPESIYSYGHVQNFAEDADKNIWLLTKSGLVYWNRKTNTFNPAGELFPSFRPYATSYFSCIYTDRRVRIWFGMAGSLLCYDPQRKTLKKYLNKANGLSTFITCIFEDREGMVWAGTQDQGLWSIDPATGKTYNFLSRPSSPKNNNSVSKQLSSRSVLSIEEDSKGNLWIGTSNGLNLFNRKDSTFRLFIDESKGFTRIRNITEGKDGKLWLGTWEGGLFSFDPAKNKINQFTESDGLLFNAVYNCLPDNIGIFWLTSPRGITRFDPATGLSHPLTITNGLPDIHIDYGGFITTEGNFLVSTTTGFFEFNPKQFAQDSDAPLLHIESITFRKSQKGESSEDSTLPVFENRKFYLRYDENKVTFRYIGIHYQNAAMTQYVYKLDGYDNDWINAGTSRTVTYTNLSSGTYTFRVKAANSDGVWSREKSLTIIILSPWWQTWWAYLIYVLILVVLVWGFINYRSRNLKRKNQILEKKVSQRTNELKQSLDNLKSTQKQLIQSEKMASLGELTAGIAHEIQNPLNFVNNFSDINTELISEADQEIDKGNVTEAKAILNDIKENEEKINHHGKRADAIVKGMLQHSRTSTGQKELTDINALCDEYLRLAYHGMRAKDKGFNCEMKTDFDSTLPKINVIPQDIGRVMLNLINNSLYAVNEKKKTTDENFKPTLIVSTQKENNKVVISVTDNGSGIPSTIKDKVFQPFFTTKPTGKGTGLGLSLSYDIIKAHGGNITIQSTPGKSTTFTITLPTDLNRQS